MESQFKHRLIVGLLGTFFVTMAIYFSHHIIFKSLFILLTTAVVSLALLEYYQLAEAKGYQPLVVVGLCSTVSYILATALTVHDSYYHYFPDAILLISLILFFLAFFQKQQDPLVNLAITIFGIVYLTIPLTTLVKINYFEHGRLWLAYALVTTKAADMGAYFSGKLLGKNLLAPSLSPNKTIEGLIGGTFLSLISSLVFYFFFFAPDSLMTLGQAIWVGLLISALSQLGDLAESLLKRDAGVKDSSRIPGVGGLLDIMDSLVFTLPFVYLLLHMHIIG